MDSIIRIAFDVFNHGEELNMLRYLRLSFAPH